MATEDTPLRDLQAFLAVARLLPLEQRVAVVCEVMTLLDDVDPERARSSELTLAGWKAAAAEAIARMKA